jgi:hypothetical protein
MEKKEINVLLSHSIATQKNHVYISRKVVSSIIYARCIAQNRYHYNIMPIILFL